MITYQIPCKQMTQTEEDSNITQKLVSYTVFLRIEVAPELRPPLIRSRFEHENTILKAILYRVSSNIGSKITAEKNGKRI